MAVFGKVPDPSRLRDAIENEFFRWLTKPGSRSLACWSSTVFVSSWSADSRRAIAHESGSRIGFPNVA